MIDTALHRQRLDRLAGNLVADGIDCAAFLPGANFYYLTGLQFHLMERPTVLFITADSQAYAIIPELEGARWQAGAGEVETIFWQDSDGFNDAFEQMSKRLSVTRIGVEGQRMRVFEADALRRHWGPDAIVDAETTLSKMRILKDECEIDRMRRAIEISEQALERTICSVTKGMSERDIQRTLTTAMFEAGADGLAFGPIVLIGAGSADPHGSASDDRKLERGDALLIDFGASHGGYHADITRTFFCEKADAEHRALYETVAAANAEGRRLARPDMTCEALDEAVTAVLKASPFADLIVHKTGHGLGLNVHEDPHIMIGSETALEPGMVFTVEPGLYRHGSLGVRIEDDVQVTSEGCISLTTFDRSLLEIG